MQSRRCTISCFIYCISLSLLRTTYLVSQFPHHVKFDKLFPSPLFFGSTFYLLFVRMSDKQQVKLPLTSVPFPPFICLSIRHHQSRKDICVCLWMQHRHINFSQQSLLFLFFDAKKELLLACLLHTTTISFMGWLINNECTVVLHPIMNFTAKAYSNIDWIKWDEL